MTIETIWNLSKFTQCQNYHYLSSSSVLQAHFAPLITEQELLPWHLIRMVLHQSRKLMGEPPPKHQTGDWELGGHALALMTSTLWPWAELCSPKFLCSCPCTQCDCICSCSNLTQVWLWVLNVELLPNPTGGQPYHCMSSLSLVYSKGSSLL